MMKSLSSGFEDALRVAHKRGVVNDESAGGNRHEKGRDREAAPFAVGRIISPLCGLPDPFRSNDL